MKALVLISVILTCISCSKPVPDPIRYGLDQCTQCKMMVEDQKFAAEARISTGKTFIFDSPECLAQWVAGWKGGTSDIADVWVTDFIRPGSMLNAKTAFFLQSPMIKSPMGLNYAAFATEEERHRTEISFPGQHRTWENAMRDAQTIH